MYVLVRFRRKEFHIQNFNSKEVNFQILLDKITIRAKLGEKGEREAGRQLDGIQSVG